MVEGSEVAGSVAVAVAVAVSREEVRAVAGEPKPMTRRQRRQLERAVDDAERRTGLDFCVYVGPGVGDAREDAERAFVEEGLAMRPAVLVAVAPDRRRVDVVTAPSVRERLPDPACRLAVAEMRPFFTEGRFVDGLIRGVTTLAAEAGPGRAEPGGPDTPDVFGE